MYRDVIRNLPEDDLNPAERKHLLRAFGGIEAEGMVGNVIFR